MAITVEIKNKCENNIDTFLNLINEINNKEKIFFLMVNGDDENF